MLRTSLWCSCALATEQQLYSRNPNRVSEYVHGVINADKTKYMLFAYSKNIIFPIIKIGNNKISETSATKFMGIHPDKKINFENHITEMSKKVAKSIKALRGSAPFDFFYYSSDRKKS